MISKRASVAGLVSLLALTAGCEIDRPPALREAMASEPRVAAPARVVHAAAAVPATVAAAGALAVEAVDTPSAASEAENVDAPAHKEQTQRAVVGPTRTKMEPAEPTAPRRPDGAASADADGEPVRRPVRFPRPAAVRGLYTNAWAAGSAARMDELLGIARRTEVNALVIDIKDASGYVSHRTEVPLAHEIGATGEIRIRDLSALLDRLEREGVYPIARIVIVRDPILAEFRPELAVNDTAGGVWVDSKGLTWMNPYASEMWDYPIALAREVALLGFPEIQFDYVRFPDAPEDDMARAAFLGADGRAKPTVIREFLQRARRARGSRRSAHGRRLRRDDLRPPRRRHRSGLGSVHR